MPAPLPHIFNMNSPIAYDNSHAADFFRVLEHSIKQSIIQRGKAGLSLRSSPNCSARS